MERSERLSTDEELETLLDELVKKAEKDGPSSLPPGFARQVVEARPFAAWEVRQPRHWKAPALVLALLVGSSAAVGMVPLFRLGPSTAFSVWSHLLAASLLRPALAAVEAAPLLAAGLSKALRVVPVGTTAALAALALLGLVAVALPALRRRLAVDALRR